jgi:hypothetical protein
MMHTRTRTIAVTLTLPLLDSLDSSLESMELEEMSFINEYPSSLRAVSKLCKTRMGSSSTTGEPVSSFMHGSEVRNANVRSKVSKGSSIFSLTKQKRKHCGQTHAQIN